MRVSIVLLVALCAGCAQLLANAPTFEYCQDFHYNRTGNQIEITAKCAAPIGGGSLPSPANLIK